jgi:hypothetical protein
MFASERETFIEREKENVGEKKQEKKRRKEYYFYWRVSHAETEIGRENNVLLFLICIQVFHNSLLNQILEKNQSRVIVYEPLKNDLQWQFSSGFFFFKKKTSFCLQKLN